MKELATRDKTSLDIFWLKDKSLTDLDNLPEPDELAEEIIENLEAGLEQLPGRGEEPIGKPGVFRLMSVGAVSLITIAPAIGSPR